MADDASNFAKNIMDKFGGGSVNFEQVLKLLSGPGGKKVLSELLSDGGKSLREAAERAKSGDMSGVRDVVSSISKTQEGKEILKELTGENTK